MCILSAVWQGRCCSIANVSLYEESLNIFESRKILRILNWRQSKPETFSTYADEKNKFAPTYMDLFSFFKLGFEFW